MVEEQNYEFSNSQNDLLAKVSTRMNFVGWAFVLLGIFLIARQIFTPDLNLLIIIIGFLNLLIGFSTKKAAQSFKLIVDTQGNDMQHLMNALSSFLRIYNIQFWSIIIVIVLLSLFFIFISSMMIINK